MTTSAIISIRLPPDLAAAVDGYCRRHFLSRTDFLAGLAAKELRVAYTPGRLRTGLAGADEATRRKVVESRKPRKKRR